MKTLDRYLAREILSPLLVGLIALNGAALLSQLLRLEWAFFGSSLGLGIAAHALLYIMPQFLVFTLPLAFFLALLIGLGRMRTDGELIALQAAGLGPLRLMPVPLVLGALLCLLTLPLSTYAEPWGLRSLRLLLDRVNQLSSAAGFTPGVFNQHLSRLTVYLADVDDRGMMRNILLADERPRHQTLLLAREGRVLPHPERPGWLSFDLRRGTMHRYDRRRGRYQRVAFGRHLSSLGMGWDLAGRTDFIRRYMTMYPDELREHIAALETEGKPAARVRIALQRRIALPFACLVFALLGVPLALAGRSSGNAFGYSAACVAAVGYYLLWRGFDALAEEGWMPATQAAWGPNLIFTALGLWFSARRLKA